MSHLPTYAILHNGQACTTPAGVTLALDYAHIEGLAEATRIAQHLLAVASQNCPATFSVVNEDGYLVAVATNRRIVGNFGKEEWDSRNNAVGLGDEPFDATDYVLRMSLEQLHALADRSETSDVVGQDHVAWNGPCSVTIERAVCDYFGVGELAEVTPEALASAKAAHVPADTGEQLVTLTVQVTVRAASGATPAELASLLTCTVHSHSAAAAVLGSTVALAA